MNRTAALISLLLAAPAAPGRGAAPSTRTPATAASRPSSTPRSASGSTPSAPRSACQVTFDEKTGLASGRCSVPLTSIKVDTDDTKSEHFHDWATNKKSEPKDCKPSRRSSAA